MNHKCKCRVYGFKVVGLIVSKNYQISKYLIQHIYKVEGYDNNGPQFKGLLEMEWYEFVEKAIREHGGMIVESSLLNAIIFKNDRYWGTPFELIKYVEEKYILSIPTDLEFYKKLSYEDYIKELTKNKRMLVYLGISVNDKLIGYLVFRLYSDLLPNTCENFKCLCTGEKGSYNGIRLWYKGTKFFKVAKTGWIQGGDLGSLQGQTACIFGKKFPDETYCIPKDKRGVLCMANNKKNSNASQFFILLNPQTWADYYYVAFGQLLEGAHVLKTLENLDTHYEAFIDDVRVESCGLVNTREPIHLYSVTDSKYSIKLGDESSEETIYLDQGIDFEELVWRSILRRCSAYLYFERRDQEGVLQTIVDPRDVPSTINELSWRLGLYSLPIPAEIEELFKFVVDNTSLAQFFSETSLDKWNYVRGLIDKIHTRMYDVLKDRIFVKGLTWLAFERAMFFSLETPEGFCRELMRNIAEMFKLRIEALFETKVAFEEIMARMISNQEYIGMIVDMFIEDVSKLVIKSCLELIEGEEEEEDELEAKPINLRSPDLDIKISDDELEEKEKQEQDDVSKEELVTEVAKEKDEKKIENEKKEEEEENEQKEEEEENEKKEEESEKEKEDQEEAED